MITPGRIRSGAAIAVVAFVSLICCGWSVRFETSAAHRQDTSGKKAPESAPAGLQLELSADKTEVVHGESVPFELTLTNNGADPVSVADSIPRNRAFAIRVTGPRFNATADSISAAVREGERAGPPAEHVKKELGPGEKISIQGDLVAWLGPLAPGEYAMTGIYLGPPAMKAPSNRISLRVLQATPVFAQSALQNVFLPQQTRDTAWVNRTAAGFAVFLLQSSPKNPEVSYSNRAVASIASPVEAVPSSSNVDTAKQQHVAWISTDGELQIAYVPGVPDPAAFPLPGKDLKIVETPFTDGEGNLHLILATADGKTAGLFRVPADGKGSYIPIEATPAVSAQRSLLWTRDGFVVFAWLSPDNRDVHVASTDLSDPGNAITARKAYTAPYGLANVVLAQRFNQARETYDRLLVGLTLDRTREVLGVRRVDIRTGKVVADERFTIAGLKGMTLFKTALREDLSPICSFFDSEGGLWVAQPRLGRLTPVSDSTGAPVTKACFPELVLPSRSSKLPGIYLRFIEGGKRLAVKKIA